MGSIILPRPKRAFGLYIDSFIRSRQSKFIYFGFESFSTRKFIKSSEILVANISRLSLNTGAAESTRATDTLFQLLDDGDFGGVDL